MNQVSLETPLIVPRLDQLSMGAPKIEPRLNQVLLAALKIVASLIQVSLAAPRIVPRMIKHKPFKLLLSQQEDVDAPHKMTHFMHHLVPVAPQHPHPLGAVYVGE